MSKALFIAGTGTDVGKTTIACLLARDARAAGLNIGVMKPFASGSWDDSMRLRKASGTKASLEEITPAYFKTPASAWAAALREKRAVPLVKVAEAFQKLKQRHDVVLVEGMGGVLVPITQSMLVADWIRRWKIPVLLVARWGLGTLNHTLLSLEALRVRKIPVLGLLFNQTMPGKIGFVERTNLEYFSREKFPPVLATVRYAHGNTRPRIRWGPGIRFWEDLNRSWKR